GFRPFVHRLATGYGLGGVVGNDAAGVFVEVEGDPRSLARFVGALRDDAPPLASVEEVVTTTRPTQDERAFRIARSDGSGRRDVLVSPDVATCGARLAEVADPGDRRYRYPFANCTDCGPRYTIVQDVPYDRPSTTMAGF